MVLLAEPARDPRHRFPHLIGRTRIGKADEGAAVDRVEIDARRGGVVLGRHLAVGVVGVVDDLAAAVGVGLHQALGVGQELLAGAVG